jgi:hypothetical protein
MPSSSQVMDHQLTFLNNVWSWIISSLAKQRRGEERGDLAKKSNNCCHKSSFKHPQ